MTLMMITEKHEAPSGQLLIAGLQTTGALNLVIGIPVPQRSSEINAQGYNMQTSTWRLILRLEKWIVFGRIVHVVCLTFESRCVESLTRGAIPL